MALDTASWAWLKGPKQSKNPPPPVHLALRGRGRNVGELATYCNKYWIADERLPHWSSGETPPPERRPCLLCVGYLARNGASWSVLMSWMSAQGRVVYPNTPRPRYLKAV